MQWRKASEGNLPDNGIEVLFKYKGMKYLGFYQPMGVPSEMFSTSDGLCVHYSEVTEWLDETPTTLTGWPGEDESAREYKRIFGNKDHAPHYAIWNTCYKWLKSNTAPKAEEPHRSAEESEKKFIIVASLRDYLNQFQRSEISLSRFVELLNTDAYNWYRKFVGELLPGDHPDERHPRAGTWLQERRNWISEINLLRAYIEKQPPSIKRPTDPEIKEAFSKHAFNCEGDWLLDMPDFKKAVNSLLSLQSDKL